MLKCNKNMRNKSEKAHKHELVVDDLVLLLLPSHTNFSICLNSVFPSVSFVLPLHNLFKRAYRSLVQVCAVLLLQTNEVKKNIIRYYIFVTQLHPRYWL